MTNEIFGTDQYGNNFIFSIKPHQQFEGCYIMTIFLEQISKSEEYELVLSKADIDEFRGIFQSGNE